MPVSPEQSPPGAAGAGAVPAAVPPPLWLLAELTYRCPLHCVYCSNPVDYASAGAELSTADWLRVLGEGRRLGAAQLGFSGGEPLLRDDLETLVGEARRLGFYSNLITSGVGLTEQRLARLKQAGLDHIQLSFQDSTREMNDFLSSTRTFELKRRVGRMIRQFDFPMVFNVVLHRLNIDHVERLLDLAEELQAEYVELANTQYYGWAYANRARLLPTREQLERAEKVTQRFRERAGQRMKVYFVVPDYYENRPKPCMNGWGAVFLNVAPDGTALPCHEARMLPGLAFPSVREHSLDWIWRQSPPFNAYRGDGWMREPCRTCPEKARDFGGCRCQAYLLTGDAANADPVCDKSLHHGVVLEARERAAIPDEPMAQPVLVYRSDENSRRMRTGPGSGS